MPKTKTSKQPISTPASVPKPTNPNYPSTTGKPSGGGRGNISKPKGK